MKEKFFAERIKTLEWPKGQSIADWDLAFTSELVTLSAGEMFASRVALDNLVLRQFVELRRKLIENFPDP